MTSATRIRRLAVAASAALLGLFSRARIVHAGCNLIPGTETAFNSTLGATNRPFAAPGEQIALRVRPCDGASSGLTPNATDHVVTVVFTAPTGLRHAVVLTAAADCSAIAPALPSCAAALGSGGTAVCVAGAAAGSRSSSGIASATSASASPTRMRGASVARRTASRASVPDRG
jgi:hypothetical protein